MNKKINELAYIRNQLASKRHTFEDKQVMEKVKKDILEMNTPFKELALNAIINCEDDIKNADFDSAEQEIQLIHNFTFYDSKEWNSDYFYKIELLSYLEKAKDVERLKKLIFLLANLQKKLG